MSRQRQSVDRVLVVVFTLLLLVPVGTQLAQFSGEAGDVLAENRILAALPAIPKSFDDWQTYPRRFESFYKDNFGLRPALLSIAMTLKQHTGVTMSPVSMTGKSGWIFLVSQPLEQRLLRAPKLSEVQLVEFADRMGQVETFLEDRGIAFAHFAAPEKQSIYPENLPASFTVPGKSPLDQVSTHLHNSPSYVDAKAALLTYKTTVPQRPLYLQIDTHWNCWGAYLVYQQVIEQALIRRGIPVTPVSSGEISYRDISPYTRYKLLQPKYWLSSLGQKDTRYECLLEKSPQVEMHMARGGRDIPFINGEADTPESVFKGQALSNLFRDWRSTDRRGESKMKAIILRDSFASRTMAYFSRTFSDVLYVHHESLKEGKLLKQIEKFKPDVVIFEYAERYLDSPEEDLLEPLESSLGL